MSKKKVKTEPAKWALGPLQDTLADSRQVFNANQPRLQQISDDVYSGFGQMAGRAFGGGGPNVAAGERFIGDTLSGSMLTGNPYLEAILANTSNDVTDRVNAQFSRAGMFGSGAHQGLLARELARAQNEARFSNFDQERGRQFQALGAIGGNEAARYAGVAPTLAAAGLAGGLPYEGINATAGNVGRLTSGYGTTTQRGGLFGQLLAVGGQLGAAALSDPRIKSDVKQIGQRPDGLGIYDYRNELTGQREQGVMADEVAERRPDALGPVVGGLQTVDYERLAQPIEADPKMLDPRRAAGFRGFAERFLNPDEDTLAGRIGAAFRAYGAAQGEPFSQGLLAMDASRRAQALQAQENAERAEDRDLRRGLLALQATRLERDMQPKEPEPLREARLLEWYASLTPEQRALADRARAPGFNPDAIAARTAGQIEAARGSAAARAQYRAPPSSGGGRAAGGNAVSGGVAMPRSKADYDALPPGARYMAPDGIVRVKGGR